MSLLFADIFEAIRTLRACKGTTEKCIMNYVEERVGGCLGVAHTLKTIRTLNKLVEEGVLCKKGKRYLFASKAAKCKKRTCEEECEEEEEEDDCNECEISDDDDEYEIENEDECEDVCDKFCEKDYEDPLNDDDEDDDDCFDDEDYEEDDDDDDECDEKEYRADSRDEDEIKPLKTKSPKDLRGDVSKAINNNNNNKPLLAGRSNKEGNYRPPIGDKRNNVIKKCLNEKPTSKTTAKPTKKSSSVSKPLRKSTYKFIGKSETRKSGNFKNIKNENDIKNGNKSKQDSEPTRKGSIGKTRVGSSNNFNRRYSPRRRDSPTKRNKITRNENNNKSNIPNRTKSNRSRSPIKRPTNNVYQTLNFDYPIDFGLNSFSSQIFQEPIEPEMTDLEKREENFGMDFDLLDQQNSVTSNPSGSLLKKKESSDIDLVGKKFKEDLKMDTVLEENPQDTLMRTMEGQQHSDAKIKDSKKFKKEGDKMLADDKKAKDDGPTSLCSVCEKKKRNS